MNIRQRKQIKHMKNTSLLYMKSIFVLFISINFFFEIPIFFFLHLSNSFGIDTFCVESNRKTQETPQFSDNFVQN